MAMVVVPKIKNGLRGTRKLMKKQPMQDIGLPKKGKHMRLPKKEKHAKKQPVQNILRLNNKKQPVQNILRNRNSYEKTSVSNILLSLVQVLLWTWQPNLSTKNRTSLVENHCMILPYTAKTFTLELPPVREIKMQKGKNANLFLAVIIVR